MPNSNNGRHISLAALVPYPPDMAPSQRFRIEQWIPHLAQQGISVDLLPFADSKLMGLLHRPGRRLAKSVATASAFIRRLGHVVSSKRYDAALIHRAASIAGP